MCCSFCLSLSVRYLVVFGNSRCMKSKAAMPHITSLAAFPGLCFKIVRFMCVQVRVDKHLHETTNRKIRSFKSGISTPSHESEPTHIIALHPLRFCLSSAWTGSIGRGSSRSLCFKMQHNITSRTLMYGLHGFASNTILVNSSCVVLVAVRQCSFLGSD